MDNLILTNNKEKCLEDLLFEFGEIADEIFIASAFFSDTKLLNEWIKLDKNIQLIVSLRFPTSYDSIREIFQNKNIAIRFLDNTFHSKFYVFFKNQKPFACIIGSSNLTGGGLRRNIETNAILRDPAYLNDIVEQMSELVKLSCPLENKVLEVYELEYRESQTIEKNKKTRRDLYSEAKAMSNSNWENNNSLPDNIIQIKPNVNDRMLDFWVSYKNKLHQAENIPSRQLPKTEKKYKVTIGVGTGIYIQNHCFPEENKVLLCLMIAVTNHQEEIFRSLEEKKEDIHKEIGKQLYWNSKMTGKRLELELGTDFNNAEKLRAAINWLVENTIIFYKVFPKYLKGAQKK